MLSFIVPMYNVAPYIGKCLDSLVKQAGFAEVQVIVVNDGSTDDSARRVQPYVDAHRNVHLLDKANGGLGSARNAGLARTDTDYVFFLDADDWVAPGGILRLLDVIAAERPDIIKFNHCRVDSAGNEYPDNPTVDTSFSTVLSGAAPSSACFQVFKTALFVENKLKFDEASFYEDVSLIFSVYHQADKIINLSDVLYFYRCRDGSITASFSARKADDLFFGYQAAVDYIDRQGLRDQHDDDLFLRLVRISVYSARKIFHSPGLQDALKTIIDRLATRYPLEAAFARVARLDMKATADFYQYIFNGLANYDKAASQYALPHIPFNDIGNFRASEMLNEIRACFTALTRNNCRYVIYGDGHLSKFLLSTTDNRPLAIADRIYDHQHSRAGMLYVPPAALSEMPCDLIFISVLGRETAITADLIRLGVAPDKIKTFKSQYPSL